MASPTENVDLHYDIHVFCCVNQRPSDHPRGSCAELGSVDLQARMKDRAKELGIEGIRINKAGCLNRCELGPAVVVYPEGIWYSVKTPEDVEEVLQSHILGGDPVERLRLAAGQTLPGEDENAGAGGGGGGGASSDLRVRVSAIEPLTPDIKMFQLVDEAGGDLVAFEAGAHIDIMTGNGLRRSYSLANDPAERGRYVTAILREAAGGGGSAWMHDEVSVSDSLTIKPPINAFALDESATEHILIAGGIGITPILAMGYRLRDLGAKATLHYCTKSPEETAFLDQVSEVFGAENVVFWHDGGDPSKGIKLDEVLGEMPEGAHLYLCGPGGLIDAAKAAAGHWPTGSVHAELFGLAKIDGETSDAADDDEPFEIELKKSGKTLTVAVDKTILEAMTEAGIEADSACEQGLCGTCEVVLLAGEADHRDQLMNDDQKSANDKIFICISRAKPGEKLILDL